MKRLFLVLAYSAFFVFTCSQLVASVFFVERYGLSMPSKYLPWKEYVEMEDRLHKAIKTANANNNAANAPLHEITLLNNLTKKFMLAAVNKAKQKGATALLEIRACGQDAFIIDPAYDLTQEIIEELNKAYVPYLAQLPIVNIYTSPVTTLTVTNHNLSEGSYILIKNAESVIGLNDNIYRVTFIEDENTFTIGPAQFFGTYNGGGIILVLDKNDFEE